MNSNQFSHQSNLPGRNPNPQAGVAESNLRSPIRRVPVAAVVRPMQQVAGTNQSVRVDAAEPQAVRPPHIRSHQLEDYVEWLRQQGGPRNQHDNRADGPPRDADVKRGPAKTTSVRPTDSQPTHIYSVSAHPQSSSSKSSDQQRRFDPAHAADGTHRAAPQPNVPPTDFHFEADLERILKKLNMPEVLLPSKPSSNSPAIPHSQSPSANDRSAVDVSNAASHSDFQRIDSPVDTNEIIRSVAHAIASVLTDQSEATIESKIREHLQNENRRPPNIVRSFSKSDSVRPAVRMSPPLSTVSDLRGPRDRLGAARPVAAEKIATQKMAAGKTPVESNLPSTGRLPDVYTTSRENTQRVANEKLTTTTAAVKPQAKVGPEIPTHIAAWDVDDFRWPTVSTQIISAGATAMETLANTVFQTLDRHQKRVGVTSPGSGQGTTSIAISLARWAAACGLRVLLIDANLANPGLSSLVGLGPNISWVNAVNNSLDPAEVTIRSQSTPLCIMPLAPIVTRVGWPRFIFDQLGDLINQVADGFELIVFDLGPVHQLVAELSQSRLLIDAGLIVHNGNSPAQFLPAKERLEKFGLDRFIVAQNAVQSPTQTNVA